MAPLTNKNCVLFPVLARERYAAKHRIFLVRFAFDTTIDTNVLLAHIPQPSLSLFFILENIHRFFNTVSSDTTTYRFTMKIVVQYFVISALIVGSAKAQCRLADNCIECLNIAKPSYGDG